VGYEDCKELLVPLLLFFKIIIRGNPAVTIGTKVFSGKLIDLVMVPVFLKFMPIPLNLILAEIAWAFAGKSSFFPYVSNRDQAESKRYNTLFPRFSALEEKLSEKGS
jgi:hypothetical protein